MSDYPLQRSVPCLHCGEENAVTLDAQQVVAESVLRFLDDELPGLIGRHLRDASSGAGHFRRGEADQLKRDLLHSRSALAQAQGDLVQLRQEGENQQRQLADLNQRLTEKLADQTSGRADVGTTMHTAHRQVCDQVSGLYSRIHRISREWSREVQGKQADRRILAIRSTILFRLLFVPDIPEIPATPPIADRDREAWESFASRSEEARSLTSDSTSLAGQIKDLPGCQQWIWDLVRPGAAFNSNIHLPWQGCLEEGNVDFAVIPAYVVDLTVIGRPQVFTSWS